MYEGGNGVAIGFLVVGTLLALVSLIMLRQLGHEMSRRRRRYSSLSAASQQVAAQGLDPAATQRLEALSVLSEPIDPEGAWVSIGATAPARQFKLGGVFGFGAGLTVAGLVLLTTSLLGLQVSWPVAAPARSPGARVPEVGLTGISDPVRTTGPNETPATAKVGGAAPAAPKSGTPSVPATVATGPVVFAVQPGENAVNVAARLEEGGIIQSRQAFLERAVERKADARLQAGQFRLTRGMTVDAVIDVLAP